MSSSVTTAEPGWVACFAGWRDGEPEPFMVCRPVACWVARELRGSGLRIEPAVLVEAMVEPSTEYAAAHGLFFCGVVPPGAEADPERIHAVDVVESALWTWTHRTADERGQLAASPEAVQ